MTLSQYSALSWINESNKWTTIREYCMLGMPAEWKHICCGSFYYKGCGSHPQRHTQMELLVRQCSERPEAEVYQTTTTYLSLSQMSTTVKQQCSMSFDTWIVWGKQGWTTRRYSSAQTLWNRMEQDATEIACNFQGGRKNYANKASNCNISLRFNICPWQSLWK